MSKRISRSPLRAACLLGLAAAVGSVGCARYRSAPLDLERSLRAPPAPHAREWKYGDAVRWAVEHNPDLVALRARAAGVNTDPPAEPVELSGGADSDHRAEAGLALDALSLLGLGTRSAERALACARRHEAWMEHHQRAREIAGELAEVFAVEHALAALTEPETRVDASAFVRAGLDPSSAETAAAATASEWEAEKVARDSERRSGRLALARLLGLAPTEDAVPLLSSEGWPAVPEPTPAALVAARADVQRKVAAFEVADRDLRLAVASQYPGIVLEPGVAADPSSFFGSVRLRLPIGASTEVRAAEARREAARSDADAAVLDAVRDAGETRVRWTTSVAVLGAARKRFEASGQILKGSLARLQVTAGPVLETVFAADGVVTASVGLRDALVEEARARVRAARAAGWPAAAASAPR